MLGFAPGSERVSALLVLVSLLGLAGCSTQDRMLSWTLEFDESVDTGSVRGLQVSIRRGDCSLGESALEMHRDSVSPGSVGMSSPSLAPGEYAFSVEALDEHCQVLADGCTTLELPLTGSDNILVMLEPGAASAPCANCVDGACVASDAGRTDAGTSTSYIWSATNFEPCSVTCGAGVQTRAVTCVDAEGVVVAESLCQSARPDATRPCDEGSPICGFGNWLDWGTCESSCTQTRTRPCDVPGHCGAEAEQTIDCSGGECCPNPGVECGPTTFEQHEDPGWVCREQEGVNILFYSMYRFTKRVCNAANGCGEEYETLHLECLCDDSGPGCTSSTSGCNGALGYARCRDRSGTDAVVVPCPTTDVHAQCF